MAQRDWFRVGHSWTDDEDIDQVGLAGAGLWTHLCCLADADGYFEERSARTRLRRFPDFPEAWASLTMRGLVIEARPGVYRIKGWEKHQFAMTGAERKQQQRDRDRADPSRVEARQTMQRLSELMKDRT